MASLNSRRHHRIALALDPARTPSHSRSGLEVALSAELKRQREAEWLEQNKEAIEAYNREIAEFGLFSDGFRQFCR